MVNARNVMNTLSYKDGEMKITIKRDIKKVAIITLELKQEILTLKLL